MYDSRGFLIRRLYTRLSCARAHSCGLLRRIKLTVNFTLNLLAPRPARAQDERPRRPGTCDATESSYLRHTHTERCGKRSPYVRTVYEAPGRASYVRLNITMVLGHRQLAVLAVGVRLGQVCEASLVVAAPEEPAADQERLPKLDEEVKRGAALSACEEVCVPRNVARDVLQLYRLNRLCVGRPRRQHTTLLARLAAWRTCSVDIGASA